MKLIQFRTHQLLRDSEKAVLPQHQEQFQLIKNKILTNGYRGSYECYRAGSK